MNAYPKRLNLLQKTQLMLALLCSCTLVTTVQAASDDLSGATVITSLPFTEIVDNSSFTLESNDDCLEAGSYWYSYTPPVNTTVVVTINGPDTELGLQTGNSFPLNQIECVDNDDYEDEFDDSGLGEFFVFDLTGGTTYLIEGGSDDDSDRGLNLVRMFIDNDDSGADDLADAVVVNSFPFEDYVDSDGFGFETNEVQCGDNYQSFWYQVTPPQTGILSVESWGADTEVQVFTGSSHPLTEVNNCTISDEDNLADNSELYETRVNAGTTYFIQIGDNTEDEEEYTAHLTRINFTPTAGIPVNNPLALGLLVLLLLGIGAIIVRRKAI